MQTMKYFNRIKRDLMRVMAFLLRTTLTAKPDIEKAFYFLRAFFKTSGNWQLLSTARGYSG
jgi:hypothetical protein